MPERTPIIDVFAGDQDDARLLVLRLLEQDPCLSQRALAKQLGISLGKTHYLLQALLAKGLLKMRNFERSDHKLAYSYLLTPAGIVEKARMTRDFLRRKEEQFQALRVVIDQLHKELAIADHKPPPDSSTL
jgi:EPS-associated MarR family transcriptional regulator